MWVKSYLIGGENGRKEKEIGDRRRRKEKDPFFHLSPHSHLFYAYKSYLMLFTFSSY